MSVAKTPRELLIGGVWTPAADSAKMPVHDPSTGAVLCDVADASPEDGARALQAAVTTQDEWAVVPSRRRSEILRVAYELITAREDEFAELITLEMGKPFAEARGEVRYAAEFFRWFSEEAVRVGGDFCRSLDGQTRMLVMKQPVGPCVLITPWNFPLAMGTRKIGPAIAAGCTMVFKPAPQTPLSSLALAALLAEAGLPAGVLNVVTTSKAGQVIEPLLRGGRVRKLSFTGSTQTGRVLLEQCAGTVVRTSLELGGNAPFIVFPDADLEVAVESAMQAKMRNMGEACTAANRMFAHEDLAAAFTERLAARMRALCVGTDVGPLIDESAVTKVAHLVRDATSRGARVVTGGSSLDGPEFYFKPAVLADVPPDAELLRTEIFGPVAALQTFRDFGEVIARANDTEWGLVAYVMSQDIDRALTAAERLAAGMVGVNTGLVSNHAAPFGGIRQSGLGREGGRTGIDEFLDIKYVAIPVRRPRDGMAVAAGTSEEAR